MRVVWVVDNHGAAEPVAVLGRQMTVIPEGSRLVGSGEIVEEGISCGDGALVHKCWTIRPVGAFLEEPMPVLQCVGSWVSKISIVKMLMSYNGGGRQHGAIVEVVDNVQLEVVALQF